MSFLFMIWSLYTTILGQAISSTFGLFELAKTLSVALHKINQPKSIKFVFNKNN
jgi:hypothetical protein